jgi:hypothetical protein
MEMGIVTGRNYVPGTTRSPLTKRQLQDMRNMGATTIRLEFEDELNGNGTGRTEHINAYRNVLQWAGEVGLKVIGVLSWSSLNPATRVSPGQTASKEDFDARFVPRFLDSYDWHEQTYGSYGSLEGYEIWNEPDVTTNQFYRNGRFMGDEVALLHVRLMEAKVLPKPAPRRQIIFSAIVRADELNGLGEILNTDTIRWYRAAHNDQLPCDIFAIHTYGSNQDPASPQYTYDQCAGCPPGTGGFEHSLDLMLAAKTRWNANSPLIPTDRIYLTEVGFDANKAGGEQKQAAAVRYAFEKLLHTRFARIKKAFHYNFRDDEVNGQPGEGALGVRKLPRLVNGRVEGGEIKLAWNALRNLNNRAGVGQQSLWTPHQYRDHILAAFNRFDTPENLTGYPDLCSRRDLDPSTSAFVHQWGAAFVQFFNGGAFGSGQSVITYVPGEGSAAVIAAGMFDYWLAKGGGPAVGFPCENGGGWDAHLWEAGPYTAKVQDLRKTQNGEKAIMMRELAPVNSPSIYLVFGDIYTQYMAPGRGLGFYGPARGEAVTGANGKRSQTFANGMTITER